MFPFAGFSLFDVDQEHGTPIHPVDPIILSLQITTLKWIVVFFQPSESLRPDAADANKRR